MALLIGANSRRTATYDQASSALFAEMQRAGGQLSDHRRWIIDLTIRRLKDQATWDKLDFLQVYAGLDSVCGLINWKTPGTFNGTATGSPTFAADRGYTGADASTTAWVNTGFNPSTAGGNYAQDSAHIAVWCVNDFTSTASGGAAMGLQQVGATQSNLFPRYSDGSAYYRINDNNASPSGGITTANSQGFYVANRTGAAAQQGYKNGADQSVVAASSAAVTNESYAVCAIRRTTPDINLGYGGQIAMASAGGSLSASQVLAYYMTMLEYMKVVGVV